MRLIGSLAALLFSAAAALADPVGIYDVVGINPDSGTEYTGQVQVSRTGATYEVAWSIGGESYIGTGLGALFRDDKIIFGEADTGDTALSVGYVSGRTFGMAMYFERKDGRWEGIWTYAGSRTVAKETWHPR